MPDFHTGSYTMIFKTDDGVLMELIVVVIVAVFLVGYKGIYRLLKIQYRPLFCISFLTPIALIMHFSLVRWSIEFERNEEAR